MFALCYNRLALSLGGTCTGEHGIGRGKVNMLREQFGPDAVAVMQSVKAAFDPRGIMNPGKIFL
jgi:D-lactate dehydrogenase (cytochrome)